MQDGPSLLDSPSFKPLLSHLSQLLSANIQGSTLSGHSHFETLSKVLKKMRFSYHQSQPVKERPSDQYQLRMAKAARPVALQYPSHVQDLERDKLLLEWAGYGVSEEESELLSAALNRLATRHKTSWIRFWGRIQGRKDYFVIQGRPTVQYGDLLSVGQEPRGEGLNLNTYWVTCSLFEEWRELPLITGEQLAAARKIRYIFKGELEGRVDGYPIFPGQEKHLLRAQITRINHACELAPKGLYKLQEDNPKELDFEDQFKMPEPADLANLETWVHKAPYVLKAGRCSHFIDPTLPEDRKEALAAQLAEKDPEVQWLKGIVEQKRSNLTSL